MPSIKRTKMLMENFSKLEAYKMEKINQYCVIDDSVGELGKPLSPELENLKKKIVSEVLEQHGYKRNNAEI